MKLKWLMLFSIMLLSTVAFAAVVYPGGTFKGPVDMYGYDLNNATNLEANITQVGNLTTWLEANNTRVGVLETDMGSNTSRVGTLETDLGNNATRVGTLESDLWANATRTGTLETDMATNATKADNALSWLALNKTRIDDTQSWLGTNVTYLRSNATKADNALSWLALNKTRIDDAQSWLGTNVTYLGTNATAIGTLQTDLGNNVSKITTIEGYEHIVAYDLGSPIVDTVDYIKSAQTIDDSGPWNITSVDAQPDITRGLTVTPNTTISVTFHFHGTDEADTVISETLTFAASSTAQETLRAFKTIDYCIVTKTGGSNATFTTGVGGRLGLPVVLTDTAQVLVASLNSVREGTFPTVTVSGSVLSLNTVDILTATAGTPVKVYVMV
jgi:hypothetical protein